MDALIGQTGKPGSRNGFVFTDKAFHVSYGQSIYFIGLFLCHKMAHIIVHFLQLHDVLTQTFVEVDSKLNIAQNVIVPNGGISRGLIGHMHFMTLIYQADKSAAHRNHVIVWMRRKNERTFFCRQCTFWPLRVVCIVLSAWPTCYSMLYLIKNINVNFVAGALFYR